MELCAYANTVIGSIASGSYVKNLLVLAESAVPLGFACIVTQPYDTAHADELRRYPRIHMLSVPAEPLLPRGQWCGTSLYGWRRVHLHKVLMMRRVLLSELHLLSLDANYALLFNPVPLLLGLPLQPGGAWTKQGHPSWPPHRPVEVVAVHDGPHNKMLNVGLLWVRSSEQTRRLAVRVENRTWAGWDQYIFNEEINYIFNEDSTDTPGFGCCHTVCLLNALTPQYSASRDNYAKSKVGATLRKKREGPDRCAANGTILPSMGHSPISHFWALAWDPSAYNVALKYGHRKSGRCTTMEASCVLASGNVTQSRNCTAEGWPQSNANNTKAVVTRAQESVARFEAYIYARRGLP